MFNYERLSDDIKIAVSSDHTFGTDAVILSDFAKIKPRDKALDMGTGCGIIPLLWLRNEKINNVIFLVFSSFNNFPMHKIIKINTKRGAPKIAIISKTSPANSIIFSPYRLLSIL